MSIRLIPCLLAVLFLPGIHTAKGQTQQPPRRLGIYGLTPFERAVACTKFYEGWHGEKKHLPYIEYGHKLLPGEGLTHKISRAQGDSLLRADIRKLCRMFPALAVIRCFLPVLPIRSVRTGCWEAGSTPKAG